MSWLLIGVKGLNKSRCWKVAKVHALSVEKQEIKITCEC